MQYISIYNVRKHIYSNNGCFAVEYGKEDKLGKQKACMGKGILQLVTGDENLKCLFLW